MAVIAERGPSFTESLEQARFLAVVDGLNRTRLPDGSFDPAAIADQESNLMTGLQESAMPFAVTTTFQRVEWEPDAELRLRRVFRFLGRTAVENNMAGYQHHFSEPAFLRVGVEVEEAAYNQDELRGGITQAFISPRMSKSDASEEIAKMEHLFDDDAVRTATAITDGRGNVIACRRDSLLVRDIPLTAWVTMLKDPGNIFGKSFELRNEDSALSVMELFREFDLPDERLPNGPVTLVEAVLPYIWDVEAHSSVERQISRFKSDQQEYRRVAEARAKEWLAFEMELADSLESGWATLAIQRFILTLQHQWGTADAALIEGHHAGNARYFMSRDLAARLENAQQNILSGRAAIQTGNEEVLQQMDEHESRKLQEQIEYIDIVRANGVTAKEIMALEVRLSRRIARQNLMVGGGCMARNKGEFNDEPDTIDPLGADAEKSDDKDGWAWKRGACRVQRCPSPNPTEVGPCSVCRRCQRIFDKGGDPTGGVRSEPRPVESRRLDHGLKLSSNLLLFLATKDRDVPKVDNKEETKQSVALAA